MDNFFYITFAPWLVFVALALIAKLLLNFAKKRRGIAIAFGVFVQMFMPDPMVEQTIKTVVVLEKRQKKTQQSNEMNDKAP